MQSVLPCRPAIARKQWYFISSASRNACGSFAHRRAWPRPPALLRAEALDAITKLAARRAAPVALSRNRNSKRLPEGMKYRRRITFGALAIAGAHAYRLFIDAATCRETRAAAREGKRHLLSGGAIGGNQHRQCRAASSSRRELCAPTSAIGNVWHYTYKQRASKISIGIEKSIGML